MEGEKGYMIPSIRHVDYHQPELEPCEYKVVIPINQILNSKVRSI